MTTTATCPACGAPVGDDKRFCSACGHGMPPVDGTDRRPACGACGAAVAEDARFCPTCGWKLPDAPSMRKRVVRPRDRRRPARPGQMMWRQILPAFQLWLSLLVIVGVTGLAGHLVDLASLWVDVTLTALTALVVIGFCLRDGARMRELLSVSGFDERNWWHPLVGLAGMMLFLEGYFWIVTSFGGELESNLQAYRDQGWPLGVAFLLVSLCPALFEELAFRGFILGRLDRVMGPWEAVAVQAAMFSVLHLFPLVFVSHFAMGFILGILRRTSGSLYPSMAVHALWNAWVVLSETTGG